MPRRPRPTKAALALGLALAAAAPATAPAHPVLDAWPPNSQPNLNALASTPSPREVITVTAPGGFDWGDASIGAGAGLGLALATFGTGLVIGARRRHDPHQTIR